MKINYGLNAKEVLNEIFPGGISDFEFSISSVCSRDNTTEISVYSLTPGLSGAAVFKINRLRNQDKLIPLFAKASKDKNQIQEEKDNCNKWINGIMTNATPRIIDSHDQYILYFEYAAYLSNYDPKTLRDGYSDTSPEKLKELMKKIGDSLQQIQVISLDSMSVVDRMPELKDFAVLKEKLQQKELPNELIDALIRAWSNIKASTDECLMLRSTKAHGDLNSGNILHEPGQSYPVIIDFASMRKSDDNREYNEDYHHYPFWDYAKLERDIITRLFLKEADNEKISHSDIIHIVKYVCGNSEELSSSNKTKSAVEKLIKTLSALRLTRNHWFPQNTQACYRSVLAYSLTKMLFRKVPDSEFPEDIQGLVAVHAALTLLSAPFENLTAIPYDSNSKPTKADPLQIVKDENYPLKQRLDALQEIASSEIKNSAEDYFHALSSFLDNYSRKYNLLHLNAIRMPGADANVSFQMLKATSRTLQRIASKMVPPWRRPNGFTIPILTLESYFEKSSLKLSIKSRNIEAWHLPLPSGDERLELVIIRGNSYKIGSPEYEKYRDTTYSSRSTGSRHPECLRQIQVPTFAISRYPVSQAQWDCVKFAIEFPNRKLNSKKPLLPMHNIKKEEALTWCNKLDNYLKKQSILSEFTVVSLPTNEQWEIACRAGKLDSPYTFGSLLLPEYANFNPDIDTIESSLKFAPDIQLRESGFYGFCNDWGLADMHGNVFEWCHTSEPSNYDLARGGSFRCESGFCRSAFQKIVDDKSFFSDDIGFRICLNLD